ncbi:MAG: pyruvate kinase alpha/beta domain-containing protein, partial [Candidatus Hermodarchaeia archaeon]
MLESTILYFEEIKAENSDILLALVKEKAREKGIKHVVVASTRGGTGVKAGEVFKDSGINVVAVTHQIGPQGPELLEEHEER